MRTLIVIPTYNEHENLEKLVQAIFGLALDINILIVDDGSPDGTGILADKLASQDRRISVLHRPKKEGLGKAYLAGFKHAIEHSDADYIMEMDADLSHDPKYIPRFLEAIDDCDVVVGSRFYQGRLNIVNWPLLRLVFSYGASIYIRLFSRISLSDPTGGFKCFRRRVIEEILKYKIISDGYAFQIELNYMCTKMGFKIREIPIIFYDRDKGFSKMRTLHTICEALSIVWRLKPKRFRKITK